MEYSKYLQFHLLKGGLGNRCGEVSKAVKHRGILLSE
jgi:hypothetical protein